MNKNLIAAERLKQCRLNAKETLEHIAQITGVHKSTVLRWESGETGRIKITTISFLASHYNVNPAWLLGADVPKELESDTTYIEITKGDFSLSAHEKSVVIAYRNKPEMQLAVDKLLGVDQSNAETIKIAARDGSFTETTITNDDIEKINNLPDVDDI